MKIINTVLRLVLGAFLFVPGAAISDEFSIVVVPDTQLYAERFPAIINAQMKWIADNRTTENIIYVAQLGDLKDDQRCDNKPIASPVGGSRTEWEIVDAAFKIIETETSSAQPNGIPYGTVAGNHDFEPVNGGCPINWNDPAQRILVNSDTELAYDNLFGPARFSGRSYYGGSRISGSNEDNFTLFESGGVRFISINLGYREGQNPADVLNPDGTVATDNSPELTWADDLLTTYDDRIGIITSHYFMRCNKLGPGSGFCGTAAGTPLNSNGSYGTQVYDRLKNNKNLFMMLGAHKRGEAYRLETRTGMQPVHIMLANYQSMQYPTGNPALASTFSTLPSAPNGYGDSGFMRIMRFDTDTDTGNVDIETFSPPVPETPAAAGTGDQSLCITFDFPPPPLPDGVVCETPAIAARSLLQSVYSPTITGNPDLDNGLHTGSASNMSGIPFTGYAEVTTPAIINVTASGGSVPENNAAGATFNLTVPNGGVISNVTLDLFNFVRNGQSFLPPSGGIVELIMRLTHVDTGTTATIINHPLNSARFICIAGLNGDYTFDSSSGNTLNAACGSGDVRNQPRTIAPGTFRPVSDLSTLFDGEDAAGTWRLFVSDTIINTGAGQFVTNNNWRWGLNITVD